VVSIDPLVFLCGKRAFCEVWSVVDSIPGSNFDGSLVQFFDIELLPSGDNNPGARRIPGSHLEVWNYPKNCTSTWLHIDNHSAHCKWQSGDSLVQSLSLTWKRMLCPSLSLSYRSAFTPAKIISSLETKGAEEDDGKLYLSNLDLLDVLVKAFTFMWVL
jgi:hypothetical protein